MDKIGISSLRFYSVLCFTVLVYVPNIHILILSSKSKLFYSGSVLQHVCGVHCTRYIRVSRCRLYLPLCIEVQTTRCIQTISTPVYLGADYPVYPDYIYPCVDPCSCSCAPETTCYDPCWDAELDCPPVQGKYFINVRVYPHKKIIINERVTSMITNVPQIEHNTKNKNSILFYYGNLVLYINCRIILKG